MGSCTDLPDVGGWSARRLVTSLKEHLSVPLQFSGPQGFSYHEEGPAVLCCPWGYQLCLPQQEGCTVRMGGGCYMPSRAYLSLSIRTWHRPGYGLRCVPCPGRLTIQEQRHSCWHLGSWGVMGNCGPRGSWDNGLLPLGALRELCLEVGGNVCSVRPDSLRSITVQQALN